MKETGWESVFCGTLNLRVADGVSDDLSAIRALFFERPEDVKHPTDQRIPKKRGGYCYYRATASVRGETQEVLVRRAGNPHDKRCVELVAPVKLSAAYRLPLRSSPATIVALASMAWILSTSVSNGFSARTMKSASNPALMTPICPCRPSCAAPFTV